jgi:inorganic triphosphatase YgiF
LSEAELKLPTLSEHIGNLRQAIEAKAINSSPAVPTASYYDSADLKLWRRDSGLRVRYEDGRHPRRVALGSGATRS